MHAQICPSGATDAAMQCLQTSLAGIGVRNVGEHYLLPFFLGYVQRFEHTVPISARQGNCDRRTCLYRVHTCIDIQSHTSSVVCTYDVWVYPMYSLCTILAQLQVNIERKWCN